MILMPEAFKDFIDYSSLSGAKMLAESVRAYWASQGITVSTYVDAILPRGSNDKTVYVVRSDLKNGLPPRKKVSAIK